MMCCYPISITKANGDVVKVPCGRCISCRLNYGRDWATRITCEARDYDANSFVTLTYDDEHLPENGSLVKRDVQLFMKRLRKQVGKCRYYLAGEYGDKFGRPHYHLILFGIGVDNPCWLDKEYDAKHKGYSCRCNAWQHGAVFVGNVTVDSARYVAKYAVKKQFGKHATEYYESLGIIPEFCLMSRRPGIGSNFCEKYGDELREFGTVIQNGKPCPLPRFFKEKVDFCTTQADQHKVAVKQSKSLGEKPEGMTWSVFYELKGRQMEDNVMKGMKK